MVPVFVRTNWHRGEHLTKACSQSKQRSEMDFNWPLPEANLSSIMLLLTKLNSRPRIGALKSEKKFLYFKAGVARFITVLLAKMALHFVDVYGLEFGGRIRLF